MRIEYIVYIEKFNIPKEAVIRKTDNTMAKSETN